VESRADNSIVSGALCLPNDRLATLHFFATPCSSLVVESKHPYIHTLIALATAPRSSILLPVADFPEIAELFAVTAVIVAVLN
jgi:hypothetical protein